jgi:hypothetical protein
MSCRHRATARRRHSMRAAASELRVSIILQYDCIPEGEVRLLRLKKHSRYKRSVTGMLKAGQCHGAHSIARGLRRVSRLANANNARDTDKGFAQPAAHPSLFTAHLSTHPFFILTAHCSPLTASFIPPFMLTSPSLHTQDRKNN